MEWNDKQLEFLEDHREFFENEAYDAIWLKAYTDLTPFSARHLMLGIALVSGLNIELLVSNILSEVSLYVTTKTGHNIKIFGRTFDIDPSDLVLTKTVETVLTKMGASPEFTTKVIGKMKVKRV